MDETELISAIQTHFAARLPVPVHTSGISDSRPVPAVFIEDWNTSEMNFHNSPFAGEYEQDDGTQVRSMTFDFETRIEFVVTHTDQVEASRVLDTLKQELRLIRARPLDFNSEVKQCRIGNSGSPSYTFVEPVETTETISARFHCDDTVLLTPDELEVEPIQQITEDFTTSS